MKVANSNKMAACRARGTCRGVDFPRACDRVDRRRLLRFLEYTCMFCFASGSFGACEAAIQAAIAMSAPRDQELQFKHKSWHSKARLTFRTQRIICCSPRLGYSLFLHVLDLLLQAPPSSPGAPSQRNCVHLPTTGIASYQLFAAARSS